MFNITNKVYVEILDRFQGRYTSILIDGGKYEGIEETVSGVLARYNTIEDMFNDPKYPTIEEFWKFLGTHPKLKIFATEDAYVELMALTMRELFGMTTKPKKATKDKFIEAMVIGDFLQIGGINLGLSEAYAKLGKTKSHGLYSEKEIMDVPFDFCMFLYNNKLLSEEKINERLSGFGNGMLQNFIEGQRRQILQICLHNPDVLAEFYKKTITTKKDVVQFIKTHAVLYPLLVFTIAHEANLEEIVKFYDHCLNSNGTDADMVDLSDMESLVDFDKERTVESFLEHLDVILESQFFSRRYYKFNSLLIES
jgi:hypothetical protein